MIGIDQIIVRDLQDLGQSPRERYRGASQRDMQRHGEQHRGIERREDSQDAPEVESVEADALIANELESKQGRNQETAEQKENGDTKATGDDLLAETGMSEENQEK